MIELLWTMALMAVLSVIAVNLLACFLLLKGTEPPLSRPANWPAVAILLAARNEAENLPRCLAALEQLDYPADKLHVFIGNDSSTDNTQAIAYDWCKQAEGRYLINVEQEKAGIKGKANVLAQLANKAAFVADFYFITDADVAVQPTWVKGMLGSFRNGVGIVNGSTVVEKEDLRTKWQRYDWAFALGLAKAFTYFPLVRNSVSAIGNNMVVSREAYEAVGGYENIPFSVTEDYELHRQLSRLGFRSVHLASPSVKAFTLGVKGWENLLQQRKRWMQGAVQLPLPLLVILCVQALFFPAILVVLFYSPFLGLSLLLLKLLSQALLVRRMLHRLLEPAGFPFIGYESYSIALSISLLVFYSLPVPVRWKGRTYN